MVIKEAEKSGPYGEFAVDFGVRRFKVGRGDNLLELPEQKAALSEKKRVSSHPSSQPSLRGFLSLLRMSGCAQYSEQSETCVTNWSRPRAGGRECPSTANGVVHLRLQARSVSARPPQVRTCNRPPGWTSRPASPKE